MRSTCAKRLSSRSRVAARIASGRFDAKSGAKPLWSSVAMKFTARVRRGRAHPRERFDNKGVGFVSVTQNFDRSSSMGRLVLNILLSFAQFERELISERTRDKIQAARRRGKWTGGQVSLGYRIEPEGRELTVVPEEADVVRTIFDLYLQTHSIGYVTQRLDDLGFATKRHVSKSGKARGGRRWNKRAVYQVLRNPSRASEPPPRARRAATPPASRASSPSRTLSSAASTTASSLTAPTWPAPSASVARASRSSWTCCSSRPTSSTRSCTSRSHPARSPSASGRCARRC
jgi:hypothetical protein